MKRIKPAVGKLKQPSIAEQIAKMEAMQNARCADTAAPFPGMPLINNFRTNMQQLQALREDIQDLLYEYERIQHRLTHILEQGRSIKL